MAYFSFVALMIAGVSLIYAEENKKKMKLLMIRVDELERKSNTEEKERFDDES